MTQEFTDGVDIRRDTKSPEGAEREAAWLRGRERATERANSPDAASSGHRDTSVALVKENAFVALAENVRDYAIFLMDVNGIITFWGEGARLMKWWSEDEAEGSHLRMLYPAGGAGDGTAEQHIREATERGEYTGEGERVRSDGSTFWAGLTLTALRSRDGTLVGFAKVTRDLTARRAADVLLQSAAAAAEQARADADSASLAKSGFLATMSHEIRTPIHAMIGYLDLLRIETDGPLTAGQGRHVSRALSSAQHLLALVTEVLDFSQIEADRASVSSVPFRIGDAVTQAISLVEPQAHFRHVEITDASGGYDTNLMALGDEARVRQIVVNLLANAVKFTEPREGSAGRVTVSAGGASRPSTEAILAGDGPWVYVRVEDTGIGIPAEQLEPIFDPFVQADMTLTRMPGGTGLGLAISRRLARLMGGDITVRSVVGMGSTFLLWLPASPLEAIASGGVQGHGPGGEGAAIPDADAVSGETATDVEQSHYRLKSPRTFRLVSDAVLAELERVLHAYVARLQSDPATPSAHHVDASEIEDHLATFLGDLASTLQNLDGPFGSVSGPTRALLDSSAIQRLISERHGASRARLGWDESELQREFVILREELELAVKRQANRRMRGPDATAKEIDMERALEVLNIFVTIAERMSLDSWRRERDGVYAGERAT